MTRFMTLANMSIALLIFMIGATVLGPVDGAQAQTVEARFATSINPSQGTDGADQFEVIVELQSSSETGLGSSTFLFRFNDAALQIPSRPAANEALTEFEDIVFDQLRLNPAYEGSTVTRFGEGNILAVNIVYDGDSPLPLTSDFTDIVRLKFDILDETALADLEWILADNSFSEQTIMLAPGTSTGLDVGTFEDDSSPLPVELVNFSARSQEDEITLVWETLSETKNSGFAVHRKTEGKGWERLTFIAGAGTTSESRSYRFSDANYTYSADTLQYRLEQVDTDGTSRFTESIAVKVQPPLNFQLEEIYPNPVNDQAIIRYSVPRASPIRLEVFDILGRRVATIADRDAKPGRSEIPYQIRGLASGTYFLRLTGQGQQVVRKFTVVR